MAMKGLRYASLGVTVAMAASAACADSIYMQSASDGWLFFGRSPAVPRYAERALPRRPALARAFPADACGAGAPGCEVARFDRLISEVARGYGLESALLHAVVAVESSYDPSARSPQGATGLMQLMPGTARRYGVEDALDPEQNLRGGAKYLRDLLAMFGSDIRLAIAAYHVGEGNVARYQNSVPPFRATMDYVLKVLDHYHRLRAKAAN